MTFLSSRLIGCGASAGRPSKVVTLMDAPAVAAKARGKEPAVPSAEQKR